MNRGTIAFLTMGGTAVIVALTCAIVLAMAWTSLRETTEERDAAIARGDELFADKEQLTTELQSTEGELLAQQDQNTELRDTNEGLQENIAGLESNIKGLEGDVSLLESAKEGLEAANADLTMDLSDARDRNAALEDANDGLQANLTDARAENASLEDRNGELSDDLAMVSSDLEDLQETSGTLGQLLARAHGIRQEIMDLENKLRPLTTGWESRISSESFCTGSMAPTFTCLDTYTAVTEFDPSVLVEGAIIEFDPSCDEAEPDGVLVRHRVIDIKVEDDVYYFWPKGDGNREADGCWLHQDAVDAYVVEVFYNSLPENSELWNAVSEAKQDYWGAIDAFDATHLQYCGFPSEDDRNCWLVLNDHQFDVLSGLLDTWGKAEATYDCWYDVALRSERAGHIPAHTCGDPLPA